jgi:hypothetical protein
MFQPFVDALPNTRLGLRGKCGLCICTSTTLLLSTLGLSGGRRVRFKSHKPAADTFKNVLGIVIVLRIRSMADFTPWVLASEHVLSILLPAFTYKSGGRQLQLTGMVIKVTCIIHALCLSCPLFLLEPGVSATAPIGLWSFLFCRDYWSAHATHICSDTSYD